MKNGKNIPVGNIKKTRIRELRESVGKTQAELAKELGITEKTYRGYELGKQLPSAEVLKDMHEKFGVSADYILNLSPYTAPERELVGSVTGLSDSALKTLQALSSTADGKKELETLSVLLSEQVLAGMLFDAIHLFNTDYLQPDQLLTVTDTDGKIRNVDTYTYDSLRLGRIAEILREYRKPQP